MGNWTDLTSRPWYQPIQPNLTEKKELEVAGPHHSSREQAAMSALGKKFKQTVSMDSVQGDNRLGNNTIRDTTILRTHSMDMIRHEG